ncbi:MAG TPA: metallopeptidase TldD-related protein [Candidatus Kapabacteria bacterium]|nr:metallopeptidase TldD-related protein [Candidatus Kapabacteria bacterium]
MKSEINRTMSGMASEKNPPYFLSYSITETKSIVLSASFGKIEASTNTKNRILDIDLRVGNYKTDNSHTIRGSRFEFGGRGRSIEIPFSEDEQSLRQILWQATDQHFKKAVEKYGKVLTNMAVKVKDEDTSADFSRQSAEKYIEPIPSFVIDTNAWKERLRRLSGLYSSDPAIYSGDVYFQADIITKYFVSSEGTEIQQSETNVRCFTNGMTKASDGMTLPLYRSYFGFTTEGLPSETEMSNDIRKLIELLGLLRNAPLAETFTGPAILSGEASGVFFHEIFGHRVEGHRQKDPNSSQTFKSFLNKKILPDFIDVVFDPTQKKLGSRDIVGYFKYDDEGVKAEKVIAVKDGVFKNFLMSRSPIENFPVSNGHGRRQAGLPPVARQSNLMVLAKNSIPFDTLKQRLREECKKQKKDYGLYFVEISGGFTFTGRTVPNAFNVQPLLVYKVFVDGRPDEIVRGVDLIGTPLTTFNNIVAAADDLGIFNGVCGAESGGVPVSASSPSLLVSTIEVQKKQKSQAKPPILKNPTTKTE